MNRKLALAALLGIGAALGASAASAEGGKTYLVSAELYQGDRIVAEPRLLVSEGREASASVGGPAGYAIRASLKSVADSEVVSLQLSIATKDGLQLIGSPALRLGADGATSVMVKQPSAHYRISVRRVVGDKAPA